MDELRIPDSTWMHKGKYKRYLVIVKLDQVYNIHLSDYGTLASIQFISFGLINGN